MIFSPLDQFDIHSVVSLTLGYTSVSFNSMTAYLLFGGAIILILSGVVGGAGRLGGSSWAVGQEACHDTVQGMVTGQINRTAGQAYFPALYTLFIFILVNNLVGMIPYSFATTSHFILTFGLSFSVVLGATVLGFATHGLRFFSLLVPSGCPLALLPLLVLIEFISYSARTVSLGLRLAANVLSGHMLLNILSGFTYNFFCAGLPYTLLGVLPLAFVVAFSGLEMAIAFIQAQVFVVLTCGYIRDGLDLH